MPQHTSRGYSGPAEPTEEMLQAGEQAMEWRELPGTYVLESADESLIYKAMLAAAPEPLASYHPERNALLVEVETLVERATEIVDEALGLVEEGELPNWDRLREARQSYRAILTRLRATQEKATP